MSVKGAVFRITSEPRRLGAGWRVKMEQHLQSLQARLDELNRRLAEQSVPEGRRSRVGRLTLEEKAAAARRNVKHK